jgi:two-component system chemotaxis response regulator CheB
LLRLKEKGPVRFRCHTGHAFSAKSLAAAANEMIVDTLWTAVRALEEGALLMQQLDADLHGQAAGTGDTEFHEQAAHAHRHSEIVRGVAQLREALKPGQG